MNMNMNMNINKYRERDTHTHICIYIYTGMICIHACMHVLLNARKYSLIAGSLSHSFANAWACGTPMKWCGLIFSKRSRIGYLQRNLVIQITFHLPCAISIFFGGIYPAENPYSSRKHILQKIIGFGLQFPGMPNNQKS